MSFKKSSIKKIRNVNTLTEFQFYCAYSQQFQINLEKDPACEFKKWGSCLVSAHFQYLFAVLGYYHNQGFILPWRKGKHHFLEGSQEKNSLQQTNIFWVLPSIPNMNYWLLYWIILSRSMSCASPYIIPVQSSSKHAINAEIASSEPFNKNRA